ncbi:MULTISPECIES: GNAT family N-acetyltransferase [unclassified Clostridium]|uniref:GNAT family N-acetyltransferase n=1 Tax=unclassified Clostridium TaxID=2614128 RepID=UPI000EEFD2A6|nr:GNAT family N-acetyltransferase [Clostridium sp.]
MELLYKEISQNEYDVVREMLLQDIETSEEFLWALQNEPETLTVAYIEGEIVAVALIIPGKKSSCLIVFVAPQYRRKGIGQSVVQYGENKLHKEASKIMTNFRADNEVSKRFARRFGYERQFSSAYMKHTEGRFAIGQLPVRLYIDEDYPQSHALYAQAFHEMRIKVGDFPDSMVEQPSEKNRQGWNADAANRFTYEENDEIAAHGHLEGNEISSVSVKIDLQGRGIGKKFMMYLCNEIYNRGYKEVVLWCVIGNTARKLYDSLGFRELHIAEFAYKSIHPQKTMNI